MPNGDVTTDEQLISSIRVVGLFGLYTYTLPREGCIQNGAILYGDNGVGKSTVLRLVFHLLSAADDRGHRTALYSADFKNLEVDLSPNVTVCAFRDSDKQKIVLRLKVKEAGQSIAEWNYVPQSERIGSGSEDTTSAVAAWIELLKSQKKSTKVEPLPVPQGERAFLTALQKHAPSIFILNADRRLDSDNVADPSDEMELRRVMRYEDPKRINDLAVRAREIALSQALAAASKWISRNAIRGANQGTMNVHSVYRNVLQHLVTPKSAQASTPPDIPGLLNRLSDIEDKTAKLGKYEFETPLITTEFRKILGTRSKPKAALAAGLLEPYIKSLESRLEAVTPTYLIVDKFVNIINSLLFDKTIEFTLSHGFVIQNRLGSRLESGQLSSGEQQLLLLFCYVLTGRDKPSVFMIDEPEISLNIKWQRQLIQSLLDITKNSRIQFMFASHSLELLSQHRNRVVKLVTENE